MESVNLDMDNIFEEEAGEDDFPSIGPLVIYFHFSQENIIIYTCIYILL
jgi:hypothetical protein